MSKNRHELELERLATTNENGERVYLYPEDIKKGKWKDRRNLVYWPLIIVYLVLPWIYINGKPSLMLNIFTREFTFLGNTIHGIDSILFFLIILTFLFLIAFFTNVFGRVWCGWACPQTVFIQAIFLKIEKFIEGTARERKALDAGPLTKSKFFKKCFKWFLFLIISLHITHTFIGYFIGPRELLAITLKNPLDNFGTFITMIIMTGIILIDFGWFREQFCIIACPYGRMQSVLMDSNSLVMLYDEKRGEPRRTTVPKEEEGDCINCYACVKVCPTGIDIRRGTQLECIACTQCIDACDDIMTKIKKPKGLIRYGQENKSHKYFTLKSVSYLIVSFILIISIFLQLKNNKNFSYVFYRSKSSPFSVSIDSNARKIITNNFSMMLNYQGDKIYDLYFKIHDKNLEEKIKIITPFVPFKVRKSENKVTLFFRFDPSILINGRAVILMDVISEGKIISSTDVVLVGPNE